jgi:hypothetical protein
MEDAEAQASQIADAQMQMGAGSPEMPVEATETAGVV